MAIKIRLELEDQTLEAEYNQAGKWEGIASDSLSKKTHRFEMTPEEMASVSFVAILGDYEESTEMEEKAEEAVKNFPVECRPIP